MKITTCEVKDPIFENMWICYVPNRHIKSIIVGVSMPKLWEVR
jgi:hypothetical protein